MILSRPGGRPGCCPQICGRCVEWLPELEQKVAKTAKGSATARLHGVRSSRSLRASVGVRGLLRAVAGACTPPPAASTTTASSRSRWPTAGARSRGSPSPCRGRSRPPRLAAEPGPGRSSLYRDEPTRSGSRRPRGERGHGRTAGAIPAPHPSSHCESRTERRMVGQILSGDGQLMYFLFDP